MGCGASKKGKPDAAEAPAEPAAAAGPAEKTVVEAETEQPEPGETAKGLEELRKLFDTLDKDNDGKVTGQEWGKKVKEHQDLLSKYFGGSTLKEIGEAFRSIDEDGNSSLSWEEFVKAAKLES